MEAGRLDDLMSYSCSDRLKNAWNKHLLMKLKIKLRYHPLIHSSLQSYNNLFILDAHILVHLFTDLFIHLPAPSFVKYGVYLCYIYHLFMNRYSKTIVIFESHAGDRLNIKMSLYQYRDPMLKIRRSHNRLIFNMGITIPVKDSLYIETGPMAR